MVAQRSESTYKMLNAVGTQEMEATVVTNDCFSQSVSLVKRRSEEACLLSRLSLM